MICGAAVILAFAEEVCRGGVCMSDLWRRRRCLCDGSVSCKSVLQERRVKVI